MKLKRTKLTIMILLILMQSPLAQALTCPTDSGGTQLGDYCMSSGYKNYWSAETWCDAIGGKLVDLASDCSGNTSSCSALEYKKSYWTWTSTVQTKAKYNYLVDLFDGSVVNGYRYYTNGEVVALCSG